MSTLTTQELSQRIAHLAQLMSAGAETPAEADRFYGFLEQALTLPPAQESLVTALAMTGLADIGDTDSARWLAEELDIECQLQYIKPARGREKACLLFALPVVLPSGSVVQQYAQDEGLFAELHDILSETDVIDQAASFGLVPRLFSYQELFAKSYGELRALTAYLADQVLADRTHLTLPDTFEGGPLVSGNSCSPYVDLYFIVGLAATAASSLDEIFPPLATDELERADAVMDEDGDMHPLEGDEPGFTEDGKPWEASFCPAFDDAFGVIQESLTVLPPDGLTEDLRRGLELAREIGLLRMFEVAVPAEADIWARLSALKTEEDEWFVEVSCVTEQGGEPAETVRWPVLNHETEEDALQKLLDALDTAELEQEFSAAFGAARPSSLLLN